MPSVLTGMEALKKRMNGDAEYVEPPRKPSPIERTMGEHAQALADLCSDHDDMIREMLKIQKVVTAVLAEKQSKNEEEEWVVTITAQENGKRHARFKRVK